ncbi:hydantoinase subunit beta [Pseudoxanthomonas broegbernensis]|uniref:Hydantoinase subunit beta n=1 Tax=Pseudoxanthomonas broegbernensis TaxID=83619 RepID=A0A7V8GN15_9GAMM|nr:hydantoinase/oxoprolinase family protein [Pseudoxanthomonas broegbernensis]KAF1686712.1 hydantoinase subunit beta [Pseudoxanthomonas broegbernensis]MBB6063524.1 N-methylhydantoinase A/oxoprolinase/acetone carboxylase beta subunit [Pseudoxanthomonas broegbernensis]
MRLGVDVGGTNTDAVLMHGGEVAAWTKRPTTGDVGSGIAEAIGTVLDEAGVDAAQVASVMIGTTHFTNALVERRALAAAGVIRLASPSGEALPPMTGWPQELVAHVCERGRWVFLLPGGYEVDGREIAPLDEARVRDAARRLRLAGVDAVAISSAFAPMNAAMEERAAAIVRREHPRAAITLSCAIGRLGFIERENAAILNAALSSLGGRTVAAFADALRSIGVGAPLYISQNDGTLISHAQAAAYPVTTIGSGPTNSMRGAAFLTGVGDAIVMDVGGTTTDIGVLGNGFPRESSIAVDIGGVRINSRMPDILALGLGGGTRIHLDPALYGAARLDEAALRVGPDSVGFRLTEDACLFGGATLTASDAAVAAGLARFGDPARLPALSPAVLAAVLGRFRHMLEEGTDRMKTSREDATVLAVGGGAFLVPEALKGVARVVRPAHAAVANAVGAAIAQVGAQVEQVVAYDTLPRAQALEGLRAEACSRVVAAGGDPRTVQVVEVDEVFLSYLPGRAAQVRVRAVGDLASTGAPSLPAAQVRHAH